MHIVNFKIKPHDEHNLNTEFKLTLIHMLTFMLSNNSIIKFIYFDQLYYFFYFQHSPTTKPSYFSKPYYFRIQNLYTNSIPKIPSYIPKHERQSGFVAWQMTIHPGYRTYYTKCTHALQNCTRMPLHRGVCVLPVATLRPVVSHVYLERLLAEMCERCFVYRARSRVVLIVFRCTLYVMGIEFGLRWALGSVAEGWLLRWVFGMCGWGGCVGGSSIGFFWWVLCLGSCFE